MYTFRLNIFNILYSYECSQCNSEEITSTVNVDDYLDKITKL